MSVINIDKIGLVAHYSEQGDWAFNLAFELAQKYKHQFNIFYFPESSYNKPFDNKLSVEQKKSVREENLITEERKLREYYDRYLKDYENVGFKLCTRNRHNYDLRSCLRKKEFQLLIIPFINQEMMVDSFTIKEFAYSCVAPVILVGPDRANHYHINSPARLLTELKILSLESCEPLLDEEIQAEHGYYKIL